MPRTFPAAGHIAPFSEDTLALAQEILETGGLVAIPTETVYGLAADARNDHAVARIYQAKGRPQFNPLIVHVADIHHARQYGVFSDLAHRLATAFWPGPLTLVVPRNPSCTISHLVSAGLDTIAIRVPAHPHARALIARSGMPLAAPSANASGQLSPTCAAHVAASLGKNVDLILDGGACAVGLESTVVAPHLRTLLRPGGLDRGTIEAISGALRLHTEEENAPTSPGQTLSHYAPTRPLRMNATDAHTGEAYLAFGQAPLSNTAKAAYAGSLSQTGDTTEAAANLFAMLHRLDAPPYTGIAVAPVPTTGLGLAINDRLHRAAITSRTIAP